MQRKKKRESQQRGKMASGRRKASLIRKGTKLKTALKRNREERREKGVHI